MPRLGWYAALSFGLFVLLTTWWVYFASWIGIVASIIVTGSYMTLTFWLFHLIRRGLGDRLGYAAFVCFWLAFEFLYIRAQVNFPWLVLGYGFANDVALVQWYEWTGSLGGSLWALLTNLAVYFALKKWLAHRSEGRVKAFRATRGRLGWVVALVVIPMFVSILRYLTYEETGKPYEVVVLQPNIDPYEKFGTMDQAEQSRQLLRVADSLVTPKTDYIVGPETFLNQSVWQSTMHTHPEILKYYEFLAPFPRAKLVMGATTYRLYRDPSEYTPSSRPISNDKYRYDSFNSAFQLDSTGRIPLYHKSLLVAGVEHMPHKNILGFLEKLTLRLGGTFRSHGTQAFRDAFISPQDSTRVAPVICWESVFGEYVTGYVSGAGANFLFIITNDGWWRNTPGHKQHNSYARLRAIETRRSVARSANTGISSLIDQRGREIARVDWWVRSGLKGELISNDKLTFYVRHGDYIGRVALLFTIILLLYYIVQPYIKR